MSNTMPVPESGVRTENDKRRNKLRNPRKLDLMGAEEAGVMSVQVKSVRKAKTSVNEKVYHQITGENPTLFSSTFTLPAKTDGEPYLRKKAEFTEVESAVETGWVENPSLVLIRNEPVVRTVQPTDEEREADAAKVLEVRVEGVILLRPGETLRLCPQGTLWVKSQSGEVRATVLALPE